MKSTGKIMMGLLMAAGAVFGAMAADVPTFPGGEPALKEYIGKNLKYPAPAKENGVEGVVTVSFEVLPDGSIGPIKIVRMVDPDLEQEAIRLVKTMPAWIPAEKDGQPVEAPAQVEIPFVLE